MISTAVLRISLIFSLCFVIIRAPPNSITDEELDFTVNHKSDELLKYKYVLIAFLRIVDPKQTKTGGLKGRLCPSIQSNIMKEQKFSGLVQTTEDILLRYKEALSKATSYAALAYTYRLLEWLKFSMRERDEKNEELEDNIVKIKNSLLIHEPQIYNDLINIRDDNFQKIVSFGYEIEKRCKEIKNLAQLKVFGTEQDQIVGFLRLLGSIEEEAVENELIKMPFPNNLTAYENLILEADPYPTDFRIFFKQDMVQILSKLYHAISVRSHFSNRYESKKTENIRLPDTVTDKVKYTCEVMTLFNRAIEQILQDLNKLVLSNKYDHELPIVLNRKKNRRIENYYVEEQMLDELRNDAVETENTLTKRSYKRDYAYSVLLRLIREVVSKYDEFIAKIERKLPSRNTETMSNLPDEFVVYYGRIIGWLNRHIPKNKIYGEVSKVNKVLADILISRRSGSELKISSVRLHKLPDSLNYERDLPEDAYLKVTTMDELNSFYKNGRKQTQSRNTK